MVSRLPRTGSPARTDDTCVVRYNGRHAGFYMARILPFFIVFVLVAVLYLDGESRSWFFSRVSGRHKPFSWFEFGFLLALVTAPLADLALTLRRIRPGAIALTVSKEGITGAVLHMNRLIKWSEIADVAVVGKFLTIRRQPRSLIQKLIAGRGLGDINIPVRHIDRDATDILAATRRFAPASTPLAATS